jgi:hypothetical protein
MTSLGLALQLIDFACISTDPIDLGAFQTLLHVKEIDGRSYLLAHDLESQPLHFSDHDLQDIELLLYRASREELFLEPKQELIPRTRAEVLPPPDASEATRSLRSASRSSPDAPALPAALAGVPIRRLETCLSAGRCIFTDQDTGDAYCRPCQLSNVERPMPAALPRAPELEGDLECGRGDPDAAPRHHREH